MKYLKTNFNTFLKYKLNEKVNLKKRQEQEPIEDDEMEYETPEDDEEEGEEDPIEDKKTIPPVKKSKKKEDTIDELVKEYRKLQIEWDNLFKEEPKRKK